MSLAAELQAAIERYVTGVWALGDLRRWRREHAQALADSREPDVQRVYGTLAHVLAEYLAGDRTEERVREALGAALPQPSLAAHGSTS